MSAPPPIQPTYPYGAPPPAAPPPKKTSAGRIVLYVLGTIFACGVIGNMLGDGKSSGGASSSSTSATAPPAAPKPSAAPAEPSRFKAEKGPLGLVSFDARNEQYSTYIVGEIVNTSDRSLGYAQVQFNILDESGAQIGTALDNINNLAPGRTWRFKAAVIGVDGPFRYEFADMSGF